jgi:D-beta-D-heptose 7-phosphate kinase/D-beta-D-heptose 1-phosphate adenosyltransferase
MLRIDHERRHTVAPSVEKALARAVAKAAATADIALVSDYNKGTMTPRVCRSLIDAFRRRGKPVLVGLKSRDIAKYARATGASLNRAELALVSGVDDVARGAKKIVRRLGLEFLAVTLGDKGLQVYGRRGPAVTLDAVARQVYDVTGAGDPRAGGLRDRAPAARRGKSALMASRRGIVVGKVGTTVTRDELRIRLQRRSGRRKVLTWRPPARARGRRRGEADSFTNGARSPPLGHWSLLRFASRGATSHTGGCGPLGAALMRRRAPSDARLEPRGDAGRAGMRGLA